MGAAFNFLIYYNTQEFNKEQFGDERVTSKSVLSARFSVSKNALWTEAWVEYNELVDEVDLLQLGQQS